MHDTYLSFYLKVNRIHVFVKALRGIGSPGRICFMISDDGQKLVIKPYAIRDFKSHSIPPGIYQGNGRFEVSSKKLCRIIARMQNWNTDRSYRVPGTVLSDNQVVVFSLSDATTIERGG